MVSQQVHPRVIFAGGGTLGHLMPGWCVCEEVRRLWPQGAYLFVAGSKDWDADFMRQRGVAVWTFAGRRCPPAWTPHPWARPELFAHGAGNLLEAVGLMRRYRPQVVVGLGGHLSIPVVLGAILTGVPAILLEQNAYPGRANRFLSRWAECVCCSWRGSERWLARPERAVLTGNPIRRGIGPAMPTAGDFHQFGLRPGKRTLLVLGGSRGAVALNEAVLAALPILAKRRELLQVVHAAGPAGVASVRRAYEAANVQAAVQSFIEDMAAAYRVADLVFCRAGGTTLAEVCAAGRPAIVVPYPYAAEGHQHANAAVVAGAGAALAVDQSRLTGDLLAHLVLGLLGEPMRLEKMAQNSRSLGRLEATAAVLKQVQGLILSRCLTPAILDERAREAAPLFRPIVRGERA